jgi:hypothetical protein
MHQRFCRLLAAMRVLLQHHNPVGFGLVQQRRVVGELRATRERRSCSRPISPLSGRNSTYRPVQISGTGSVFEAMLQYSALKSTRLPFAQAGPKTNHARSRC